MADTVRLMWWQGRLAAFDLETTSVDPCEARVVTAAVALCGGGQPTDTADWLVDPGIEIPPEAAEVHGVTTEQAREHGMLPADAIGEIISTLAGAAMMGWPLVIFNARYDLTVMHFEALRYGLVPLEQQVRLRIVDPFVVDKHTDRYRSGSRKLEETCKAYGVELAGAHDAAHDAVAAARLAYAIGRGGRIIRRAWNAEMVEENDLLVREWAVARDGLDRLQVLQRRWAHEQAASLAVHFHTEREFDAAMAVSLDWPVVACDCKRAPAAR